MVADSIIDSELFHGSPRDLVKKRNVNWFCKLKQWKIDARHNQWIYQWNRENVSEEENLQFLLEKLTDKKAWRIDEDDEIYLQRTFSLSASSPTSVLLKRKDYVNDDFFCSSKHMIEEEEEVFDDAYDNWDGFKDALNSFEKKKYESPLNVTADVEEEEEEDPNLYTSRKKKSSSKSKHEASPEKRIYGNIKKKKKSISKKKECNEDCPICSEVMDETDLSFQPCPCGFPICLFCHKKISENEARCPACRKEYDQTSTDSVPLGFKQRGRIKIRLSPSFKGLDRA